MTLLRLLARWPLRWLQAMGQLLGGLADVIPNEHRRITRLNLAQAFPHLSPSARAQLARESLQELSKTLLETGLLWTAPKEQLRPLIRHVSGESRVDEALAQGKGLMILLPHTGAWEILPIYLLEKAEMTALYRPPKDRALEPFIIASRQRHGMRIVPTNLQGVKALRKAFKQGQASVILPDQDPGKNGGVFAPFFGREAMTMTLAAKLCRADRTPALLACAIRLPKGGGYHLHFLPVDPAFYSSDERESAQALNRGIEQVIALAPAQYNWAYKRYKSKQAGQADLYQHQP